MYLEINVKLISRIEGKYLCYDLHVVVVILFMLMKSFVFIVSDMYPNAR